MRKRGKETVRVRCLTVSKSLAEFAAFAANKVSIIFGQGVYLTENSSQAASVGFVFQRETKPARSRLQKHGGKARRDFSPNKGDGLLPSP